MKFVYIPVFVNSDGEAIYKRPTLTMEEKDITEYNPRTLDFKGPSDRMRFAIDASPGADRIKTITNMVAEDFTGRLSGSEVWGIGVSFQRHETMWHTGESFTLFVLLVRSNNTFLREEKKENYQYFFIAHPPQVWTPLEEAAYKLYKSSDFLNPLRTAIEKPDGSLGAYPHR